MTTLRVARGREGCQGKRENCRGNCRENVMHIKMYPAEHSVDLKYASPTSTECMVKRVKSSL